MHKIVSAIAFTLLVSSAAVAGPKEEALLVLEKWSKAFSDSDVDGIAKLYSPDAHFLGTARRSL
jgi:ketosteroid isomerase-like protein